MKFGLLFILSWVCLIGLTSCPPLQDYPNHLLEAAIIAHPAQYPGVSVTNRPVPNMLVQHIWARIPDLETGGRLLLVTYVLLFGLGCRLCARQYFDDSPGAFLGMLSFLCSFYFWRGYLPFGLALALVLVVLGLNPSKLPLKARCAADPLIILLLFFVHFNGALLYGIVRLGQELGRKRLPDLAALMFSALPIIFILIFFRPITETSGIHYGTGFWKLTSLKRTLGIPYTVADLTILQATNLYNALVYVSTSAVLLLSLFRIKSFSPSGNKGLLYSLLLLWTLYLIVPGDFGGAELDSRIGLFASILTCGLLLSRLRFRFTLPVLRLGLLSSFIISAAVWIQAQPTLKSDIAIVRTQAAQDSIPWILQREMPNLAADPLCRFLSQANLNTNPNQLNRFEEHIRCMAWHPAPPKGSRVASLIPEMVFVTGPISAPRP